MNPAIKRHSLACLIGFGSAIFISFAAQAGDIAGKINGGNPGHMVVYLEGAGSSSGSQTVTLDQKNKVFIPHVTAIQKGGKVCFKNSDKFAHNVHSLGPEKFNFAQIAGREKCMTLATPGVYPIVCDMHPEMSAYVYVADNPFFARPNASGGFTIKNIPPGDYQVVVWQPKGKKVSQAVKATGGTTKVDINI